MGKIIIKELYAEEYAGKEYSVTYKSEGFYNIEEVEDGFTFILNKFESEKEFELKDEILAPWLTRPVAYGAFDEMDNLKGYVEGYLEEWNNRYRISNIVIFDPEERGTGIGRTLMSTILEVAKSSGARMVFLETQTCNSRAIAFYKKSGFKVMGFDQYAYSNKPEETHEMLVWMGLKL